MKKLVQLLKTITYSASKNQDGPVPVDSYQPPVGETLPQCIHYRSGNRYAINETANAARMLWCKAQHF